MNSEFFSISLKIINLKCIKNGEFFSYLLRSFLMLSLDSGMKHHLYLYRILNFYCWIDLIHIFMILLAIELVATTSLSSGCTVPTGNF